MGAMAGTINVGTICHPEYETGPPVICDNTTNSATLENRIPRKGPIRTKKDCANDYS